MRFAALTLTLSLSLLAVVSPVGAVTSDPCRPGDRPCWEAHIEHQRNVNVWWAEVRRQQRFRRDMDRLAAHLAAQNAPVEICNGRDLPTCAIVHRESRGNPRAENPHSSASGLYQFLDSTWRRCPYRAGTGHAAHAPVRVQVACARWLWAGGRGAHHWSL